MHNSLKIIKTLLYSYSAVHVSATLVPIIRSLLILHIQPQFIVCQEWDERKEIETFNMTQTINALYLAIRTYING
jgi:hypothetical protein